MEEEEGESEGKEGEGCACVFSESREERRFGGVDFVVVVVGVRQVFPDEVVGRSGEDRRQQRESNE